MRRAKSGTPATHPLLGDELRALRALRRQSKSPYIFVSERGAPFSVTGFRDALANKGTDTRTLQAYLGHKNIQHTVRYTELAPGRFKDLWR